jgi:propionyl-CoA carboxylase alpha chain
VWALGTRDCSLQRRHQKVIEESPAPGLPGELLSTLAEAAVAAARTVAYQGAGTVEFLISPRGRPYFLEMNTRLQVEHPVTEEVFGIDLVALQLSVAEGAKLPPEPPAPSGHAVEARLYAEDPAREWAPQAGVLHELSVPGTSDGPGVRLRIDAGYGAGDRIGTHYDAMLAKVVAWAPTRAEALRRLRHALRHARVHGPGTNRELLVRSLGHPEVVDGHADTGFYERHLAALTAPDAAPDPGGERYAAVAAALADSAARRGAATVPARLGGWRNLGSQPHRKTYGEHEVSYRVTRDAILVEGDAVRVVSLSERLVRLEVDGVIRNFHVSAYGDDVHVDTAAGSYRLTARPRFTDAGATAAPGSLLAPMPGTVVRIAEGLAEGDRVTAGQPIVWLEAMKMNHRITAPAAGTLTALHAAPGRQVELGALLAVVVTDPAPEDQPS